MQGHLEQEKDPGAGLDRTNMPESGIAGFEVGEQPAPTSEGKHGRANEVGEEGYRGAFLTDR